MKSISKNYWCINCVACILGIVLLTQGCKKQHENPVPVRGIFWDYCREKPLSGFKMQLIEFGNNFWGNAEYSNVIAESTTDANGIYDFGAPELDDRERYKYRVFPIYNSDIDKLSIGVGSAAPWNVENTDGSPRLKKETNNWDTIRACSFNLLNGNRYYNLPANANQIDSLFLTVSHKYSESGYIERVFLTYSDLVTYQTFSGTFNQKYCGNWYFKKEKKVNGIWYTETDTVYVEWKTNPAFNDTINWDW
jgi:hypothetical protein